MIARQTLNIYIQYLKNLPRLRGYSLVNLEKYSICHILNVMQSSN